MPVRPRKETASQSVRVQDSQVLYLCGGGNLWLARFLVPKTHSGHEDIRHDLQTDSSPYLTDKAVSVAPSRVTVGLVIRDASS